MTLHILLTFFCKYEPTNYLCKKPSIWACFHNLWMQGISFFKFLFTKKNVIWMTSWCCITYYYKNIMWNKTIQIAKQIANIHIDWELDGNKEKFGYEKWKRLWLQTYKLILGIGDDFALDMSCDLSHTFLSRSIKLSWIFKLFWFQFFSRLRPCLKWLFWMLSFLELEFPFIPYSFEITLLATQLVLKYSPCSLYFHFFFFVVQCIYNHLA